MKIEAITVTKYRLPNGEEYDTREAAEWAYAAAELEQEIYDNTGVVNREVAEDVAEYLLNHYTLTRKEN